VLSGCKQNILSDEKKYGKATQLITNAGNLLEAALPRN